MRSENIIVGFATVTRISILARVAKDRAMRTDDLGHSQLCVGFYAYYPDVIKYNKISPAIADKIGNLPATAKPDGLKRTYGSLRCGPGRIVFLRSLRRFFLCPW